MKALILLALGLSIGGIQANEGKPVEKGTNANLQATPPQASSRINHFNKGSELIGIEVWNPKKERLGTIKDLMLNLRQERVVYTVFGTGGFLGIGDKLVALPPSALEANPENKHLILHSDKESLRAAPGFQSNNWPEMADYRWVSEAARHYTQQTGQNVTEAAGAEKKGAQTNFNQVPKTDTNSPALPQKILRTSDLIGMSVKNTKNEKLGDVKDVAVDLQSGKILYVVVSESGFLGTSEKLFAVPPVNFQGSQDPRMLVLDVSQEAFAKAPSFRPEDWPTVADPTFSTLIEIDEPSGTPRATKSDGRTALDQSNSRRDIMITQQLRRAIMRDDTMSVLTRNITIITADGRITVRGTVANQDEVEKIVSFAREIAGNEVTNELTVQNEQESTNETTKPKKE